MKKYFLFALLVSILLFSGCIKIHINQKIYSNYDSDIEMEMDLSGAMGLMGSMPDANKNSFADICKNFEKKQTEKLENFKCEADEENYVVKVSGTTSLKDTEALQIENGILTTKYRYDASKGKDYLNSLEASDTSGSMNLSEEMNEEQIQYLKSVGVEMIYALEMPGKIIHSDAGEIKDNKVVIDLLNLTGKEKVYIESEELNILPLIAVIIAVIAVILFLFFKRKGSI